MKKLVLFLMIAAMLVGIVPFSASAAGDAMPTEEIREVLNSVELHPQKTGYVELDEVLEDILGAYRTEDAYTQIKFAYDWTILNINFSWNPYSQNWAPAYDCFNVDHNLTFEVGRQAVIPEEVANRAYHALTRNEGVCYDYAATLAVMARYIGIDSYIHTGMFTFEPIYGNMVGHHGWVELELDGERYIFDSQRDYRLSSDGRAAIPYEYFGIKMEDSWRYEQETEINALRDAQFRSVEDIATVTVISSSCTVSGDGKYPLGTCVTLTAESEKDFLGWFDENGALLCSEETYIFTPEAPVCLYAICKGEYFRDVTASDWFCSYAEDAVIKGIVSGVDAFEFAPADSLTRAMAVTIIARLSGEELDEGSTDFTDVESDSWYEGAVSWAVENGVCTGYPDGTFQPDAHITREDFITMLVRFAASDVDGAELDFADENLISSYAKEPMQKACAIGLLTGYEDNTVRPQNELTRAEGVAILMRLAAWLAEKE